MKTIQMTIDEELLAEVDKNANETGENRSAFIRKALEDAIRKRRSEEIDEMYREAYTKLPIQPDEVETWQSVQAWGDE